MSNQRYLDVIITIDGFQHGEEEFVLKAMAIVSCFHHTEWTRTYDTNFPVFTTETLFLRALRRSTPLVGRKTDFSASPTSLDKRCPELSFPGSMVASDHPDLQLGRH